MLINEQLERDLISRRDYLEARENDSTITVPEYKELQVLIKDHWLERYHIENLLYRYRVKVHACNLDYLRDHYSMVHVTAYADPDNDMDTHNLEVILYRMFPDLVNWESTPKRRVVKPRSYVA